MALQKTLTVKELAELLKVHPKTVGSWTKKNKVPYFTLPGGDIRFNVASIEAWEEKRTIKSKNIGQ